MENNLTIKGQIVTFLTTAAVVVSSCLPSKSSESTRPMLLGDDSLRNIIVYTESDVKIDSAVVYLSSRSHSVGNRNLFWFGIRFHGGNTVFVDSQFDSIPVFMDSNKLWIASRGTTKSLKTLFTPQVCVATLCDFADSIGGTASLENTFHFQWLVEWHPDTAMKNYRIRLYDQYHELEWIELHLYNRQITKIVVASFDKDAIYL